MARPRNLDRERPPTGPLYRTWAKDSAEGMAAALQGVDGAECLVTRGGYDVGGNVTMRQGSSRRDYDAYRPGEGRLGARELEQLALPVVLGHPQHPGPDAELQAADRISVILDRTQLGPAQLLLGGAEDLDEELLLGGEVPVEDALADAEAVDDVGHRGRVVAIGGEPLGGVRDELRPSFRPSGGQPSLRHGRRR